MKRLSKFLIVTGIALFFTTPAYAYIDPAVMSNLFQVIVGVVVAIGAVIGIVWTRVKKAAKEKLNIDLEGKKEAEGDVVEFDDEEEAASSED